ncbi:MAG: ankyrin repeat domain-containing protein [Steroidobacteraceae bacterium]
MRKRRSSAADDDWYEREQLHFAAADGDCERVRELLAGGADLGLFDDIGCTPLHYAIQNEHYAVARLLLAAGADINAHDDERIGETPLGRVAAQCTPEMAEFLLANGANPRIPGWMQITALDRAAKRSDEAGAAVYAILRAASAGH